MYVCMYIYIYIYIGLHNVYAPIAIHCRSRHFDVAAAAEDAIMSATMRDPDAYITFYRRGCLRYAMLADNGLADNNTCGQCMGSTIVYCQMI